ncbi:MAG: calcium-binding protein [Solirubrobacteraceae bacterium]
MVGVVLFVALGASSVGIAGPARLVARDPGARVNGDTIVVSGAGARVYGARGRPDFIAALGAHETIVGGNRDDNLAALGDGVTIIGGAGDDLLYGGRDATLIGGKGHDLLTDRGANATINADSGDVVIAEGRHDRVVCSRGSRNVTVYAGRSDSVSSACRTGHGHVLPLGRSRSVRHTARATAGDVTGDGSNGNPFTAYCNSPGAGCAVAFPARTLKGAWANEYVPAYKCPGSFPYLLNKNYAPGGATWGPGVEIQRNQYRDLGYPIQVTITGKSYFNEATRPNLFSGTLTGFPDSSATNWLWDLGMGGRGGPNSYQVILHCTSNRCEGTDAVGRPPGCARSAIADRPPRAATAKRGG